MAGLRVLDMTRVVAGPYAGQILGDLGADVIKLERVGEGDDCRRVGPPWMTDASGREDTEDSTYFHSVNRNKRSLTVDYTQPEGAQLVRDLAAKADILIENYRTGTLAKYGLAYDDLKSANPRLIYCSVTGFGQTGPYANRSGYDYLIQAMSGLMSVTGRREDEPGGGPSRVGVPIADICAGLYATIAVLAAVNHRNATGEGQQIDISLFESQIAALLNTFSAWFNSGEELGLTGNDHPSAAPYGVYRVDDGYILIATFNDREFGRLAKVLGHPEWLDDPRFAKNGARVANRAALAESLTEALQGKTKDEWVAILNQGTVSCGPINDMASLEHDPQIMDRGVIIDIEHPQKGTIKTAANPIRFSESPVSYRFAPPLVGEHTDQVLSQWLHLDANQIAALRDKKVI